MNCKNLQNIVIPTNSELCVIESNAFAYSSIRSIFIPSKIMKIAESAFNYCSKLQIIEIDENAQIHIKLRLLIKRCQQAIVLLPYQLLKNIKMRQMENQKLS